MPFHGITLAWLRASHLSYPLAFEPQFELPNKSNILANMDTNQIVRVKHVNKSIEKPKSISQPAQQALVEQTEIRQPELFEPVVPPEFPAEPTRDESVYGSGWSLAQLMNEFGGR